MERIGIRELRQNASRYLAKVKTGETVEVTERWLRHLPNPTSAPPGAPSAQAVLDELREDRL